jgi:hypothetical protein
MMSSTDESLEDVTVAVLIASEGTEEVEFVEPRRAVAEAGATVDAVGSEAGEAQAVNNDLEEGETFEVDRAFSEVSADDYDGLIVPGGTVGADRLRLDEEAVEFVREHVSAGKPAGGDLPRAVAPGRGRRRRRPDDHLISEPANRRPQRGRRVGRRGGRHRREPRDEPQARRPGRVLRDGRRDVRG